MGILRLRSWTRTLAVVIVALLISGCGSTSVPPESEVSPVFTESPESEVTTNPQKPTDSPMPTESPESEVTTNPQKPTDPPMPTETVDVTVPPRDSPL